MGTKVEINDGPVWSFKVAGDITLDNLTKGVSQPRSFRLLDEKKSQGINIERKEQMKMVITSEVENVDNWLANRVERHATILQFAENIVEYANAEANNVVALTFDIVDEKKMNELMQSGDTRDEMIRHGVKPETVTSYLEKP